MIDTLYQQAITRNLDDQLQRPGSIVAPQGPSTFSGFWRGLGGVPGGAALGFGSFADASEGTSRAELSQGLLWNPATRTYTAIPQDEHSRADAAKIARGEAADLFTSETGNTFRTVAKDFMPDPKTTGAAGQILANGASFLTQATVAMGTSGPVLGAGEVGAAAGMQEADQLAEQGVDQRTRMQLGAVAGVAAGGSMFLPMTGASALVRFGKGAAGGAGAYAAQTEAEKLILQHAGYDKLASQYDPLDPAGLLLGAAVPGVLGAALGHGAAKPTPIPDGIASDGSPTAVAQRLDGDIAAVQRELARQGVTPEQRTILQGELDKLTQQRQGGAVREAIAADPNLEPAARVQQTARAIDSSRLTPDDDLAGMDLHQQALERAADQLGAGEPVDVSSVFGDRFLPGMRESRALADRIDDLEAQRAQLLGDAANQLGPGEPSALRQQVAQLQSQLTDVSEQAVKARAKELQGPGVSYKQASARAQRELSDKLADQQAMIDRLQQRLDQHAAGAQASEHLSIVERDLAAAREKQAQLPGPATTPRRLSMAMQDVYSQLGRTPAPERTRANPDAFHAARAEAEAARAGEAGQGGGGTKEPAGGTGPGAAAPKPGRRETVAAASAMPGPSDAHLDAAVAQLDQTMLVHVEGMAEPMRLGELMEHLRAEAAAQGRDSRLLEVAAQCAISVGAAG